MPLNQPAGLWIALNRDEAPIGNGGAVAPPLALPILMPIQALALQISVPRLNIIYIMSDGKLVCKSRMRDQISKNKK